MSLNFDRRDNDRSSYITALHITTPKSDHDRSQARVNESTHPLTDHRVYATAPTQTTYTGRDGIVIQQIQYNRPHPTVAQPWPSSSSAPHPDPTPSFASCRYPWRQEPWAQQR